MRAAGTPRQRALSYAASASTAPDPTGVEVRLNDEVLEVAPDGSLPELAALSLRGDVVLPPVSYAFIVVPHAAAAACQSAPPATDVR